MYACFYSSMDIGRALIGQEGFSRISRKSSFCFDALKLYPLNYERDFSKQSAFSKILACDNNHWSLMNGNVSRSRKDLTRYRKKLLIYVCAGNNFVVSH